MHSIRSSRTATRVILATTLAALAAGSLLWAVSPVRAEAAGNAASEGAPVPESIIEQGRTLFQDTGCAQCHALADAGASGSYAPSLDNPHLTRDVVLATITEGRGDMPSFAGILSEEELRLLASYVAAAGKSG